ncbi:acyltransferase family protein [Novosphingobium kaempferiae]|uniref:acyltransferase family protein n=1 Tax=Novosphingobium kaempferiae TaxID=2896849 RepID=UPI001E473B6C|nr:acyltransferase [Novosphingobium kaempferiae]
MNNPRNAYLWMDVFRALAASLVAISHIRDIVLRDADPSDKLITKAFYFFTGFGHIGVVVFFVLSGYWITRSVMNKIDNQNFWQSYLIDRLSRLWIVLLPVIVIGGTLDWLGVNVWHLPNYMGDTGAHSIPGPIAETLGWRELIAAPFFAAAILVPALGSNGPLWSLSYEFWYYIWFPAAAMLVLRKRITPALAFVVLGFISPPLAYGFLSWLVGSALHFAIVRLQKVPRMKMEAAGLAVASIALLALLVIARIVQSEWLDPILALSFGIFLLMLCRCDPTCPTMFKPIASFGSMGSFSLYALHFPLAMALVGWLYGGLRQEPSLVSIAGTGALTLAAIAVAWFFSRATEAKTDLIRKFAKDKMKMQKHVATA